MPAAFGRTFMLAAFGRLVILAAFGLTDNALVSAVTTCAAEMFFHPSTNRNMS
jgi:hypothetical protein